MGARVVWVAARAKWYLVDRHAKYPAGRRTWALGPEPADQERGEQAADAINRARREGDAALERLASGVTLGETLLAAWWADARAGLADTTQETIQNHLRRHLIPQLGAVDLRRLSREAVKSYAGQRADAGFGQHLIAGTLGTLRRALRWAVEQGFLDREPVPRLMQMGLAAAAARGARKGVRQSFTREEAAVLLELAKPGSPLYSIVLAACQTGARKGELLDLRWHSVDFSRGRIEWRGSRGRHSEKATKANKIRYSKLSDELARELRVVQRRRPDAHRFRDEAEEHVFLDRRHKPWNYDGLSGAWKRLQRRAALRGVRPLAFHSWRHTFVSWAFEAGVNPLWIAEQIGDRPETMLRTYAHCVRGEEPSLEFLSLQEPPSPSAARSPRASP